MIRYCLCVVVLLGSLSVIAEGASVKKYNIVWDSPSRDSFDSMPLSGMRGAGANVWAEADGSVWMYLAHNGAYDEAGRLLKLGCLRLSVVGLDLQKATGFKQCSHDVTSVIFTKF